MSFLGANDPLPRARPYPGGILRSSQTESLSSDKPIEETAIDMMMVMAEYNYQCGEPAVAEVDRDGRKVPVCAWQHTSVIAPYLQ